jgi:hypothetical protein
MGHEAEDVVADALVAALAGRDGLHDYSLTTSLVIKAVRWQISARRRWSPWHNGRMVRLDDEQMELIEDYHARSLGALDHHAPRLR